MPSPATARAGTTAATHHGGCLVCLWLGAGGRCRHPDLPARPIWFEARDNERACGTRGRLWEYAHG